MPEGQGKLVGYVVVHVKPFEPTQLVVTHVKTLYGAKHRAEAEAYARELQGAFTDPWYQVAEVRLIPTPTTQVRREVWVREADGMREVRDVPVKNVQAAEPETFTCPRCGMTSHNLHDARAGYCGNCHEFTGREAQPDESGADLETRGEARGRWNLPGIDDERT